MTRAPGTVVTREFSVQLYWRSDYGTSRSPEGELRVSLGNEDGSVEEKYGSGCERGEFSSYFDLSEWGCVL